MEDHGLMEDTKFDTDLEGFYSGNGATENLQPKPKTIGNMSEEETKGESGSLPSGEMGGVASTATVGAAAAAAAATAAATASALMGGKFSMAQGIVGGAVGSAAENIAAAAVPASLQPVKEKAGAFLSRAQPWRDFLWPLSIPSAKDSCSRLTANLYNFQTNYAILFVVYLVLAIILQPSALICIGMTVVVWMFFLKKNDDPSWTPAIGGVQLGPIQRVLLLAATTLIILLVVAGSTIFHSALVYMLLACVHGIIHDPSKLTLPGPDGGPVAL